MTDEGPLSLEEDGKFEAAAAEFARKGFDGLVDAHFQPYVGIVNIARLLQSVSCDCRAGNYRRARHVFILVESLLCELEEEKDDRALGGLSREWIGDGKLMLEESDAISHYRSALECYDDLSWEDTTWRQEPEFMYAYWAIHGFSEYHDGALPEALVELSFQERIELKIEFAEELLD
jgi:hypothetical protein